MPSRTSGDEDGKRSARGKQPADGRGKPDPGERPGATIGRYVVVSRLGEGSMGMVYLAYDPELDRRVALKVLRRDTSFYMLGWTPGTYDAHNAFNALMRCVDDKGSGQFNLGAYCNPKVDELTLRIQSETDKSKRDAMIREANQLHADDVGLPDFVGGGGSGSASASRQVRTRPSGGGRPGRSTGSVPRCAHAIVGRAKSR